jgi:hypothetical protein
VAYVGNQPARGQWRKLSDISSAFDGVITTFTTSVPPGTSQYFVTAGSASQLLISLGGVIQEPDVDYTVSTNSVTFTTPPTSGLSFFGVLCGDALNAGVPSDGSVTTSKLAGGLSVGLTGGSVSTPSLFFTGDDNTGVFSAGADQLNIATNGVERVEFGTSEVVFNDGGANYDFRIEGDTNANLFFVDASAEAVGIGTSSPSELLHIAGVTNPGIVLQDTTNNTDARIKTNNNGDLVFEADYNAEAADTRISFEIDGSEKARFDSSGRLGIGTTPNSDSRLHVKSGANDSNPVLRLEAATSNFLNFRQTGSVYDIHVTAGDPLSFTIGASERARIDASGRLLVGTSSTNVSFNSAIQIAGSGVAGTQLISRFDNNAGAPNLYFAKSRGASVGTNTLVQSGDEVGNIGFYAADGTNYVPAAQIRADIDGTPGTNDMPGRLVFSTTADGASSPTEQMRISANGTIRTGAGVIADNTNGAGTTDTGGGFIAIRNNTFSAVATCFEIKTGTPKTNRLVIRNDGDVENVNNSYGALSDVKLKENIVEANSQWSDIKALQVRKYNFKTATGYGTHTQIGLVAQEAELVSPGLVTESPDRDEDGNDLGTVTKSVNYSVLYMKAVKALQEAMERIETLEASNTDLLARVTALESA